MSETRVHEVVRGHSPLETVKRRVPVDEHGRRFSDEALFGALHHLVEEHSKGLLGTASAVNARLGRAELSKGMLSTALHIELGNLSSAFEQKRRTSSKDEAIRQMGAEPELIEQVRETGLLTALEAFDKATDPWQDQWSSSAVEASIKDLGVAIDRARTLLDARDQQAGGPRNNSLREMLYAYTWTARNKVEAIAGDKPITERRPLDAAVQVLASTCAFDLPQVPPSVVNAARTKAQAGYASDPDLAKALRTRMGEALKQNQSDPALAAAVKACGQQLNEVYNRLSLFGRAVDKWGRAGPAARQQPAAEREVAALGLSLASAVRALREAVKTQKLPGNGAAMLQEHIAVFLGDAMRRAEAIFPLPPGYVAASPPAVQPKSGSSGPAEGC
jgi:hypothetical protein